MVECKIDAIQKHKETELHKRSFCIHGSDGQISIFLSVRSHTRHRKSLYIITIEISYFCHNSETVKATALKFHTMTIHISRYLYTKFQFIWKKIFFCVHLLAPSHIHIKFNYRHTHQAVVSQRCLRNPLVSNTPLWHNFFISSCCSGSSSCLRSSSSCPSVTLHQTCTVILTCWRARA